MRALATETLRISGPPDYATAGDLDWWRAADDDDAALRSTQLWFVGEELVGFAWPDDDNVDILTHPRHRALEPEILSWAEERRAATATGAKPATLRAWSLESDTQRLELFRERGYTQTETHLLYWTQPLPATMPPRPLPPGYVLRTVQGEEEFAARVAAHRSAFAPSRMTLERYRKARSMPGFHPEHDRVAVAPDGTIAAFCIIWNDGVSGVGVFEPVGTHAEHQQRGLARAVMAEGMRRLTAEGCHTAVVLSAGGRDPSYRLYQSAGFRVLDKLSAFSRQLSACE
jgi:ribosomal protein S18 acetylase RimI-like enzyme